MTRKINLAVILVVALVATCLVFITCLPSDAKDKATPSKTTDKTYIKQNAAFDPNRTDSKGKTNVQRMQSGLSPIGTDGKPVQIHHNGQRNDAERYELTTTQHQQVKHSHEPSKIDRRDFSKERKQHWKDRATDFNKK